MCCFTHHDITVSWYLEIFYSNLLLCAHGYVCIDHASNNNYICLLGEFPHPFLLIWYWMFMIVEINVCVCRSLCCQSLLTSFFRVVWYMTSKALCQLPTSLLWVKRQAELLWSLIWGMIGSLSMWWVVLFIFGIHRYLDRAFCSNCTWNVTYAVTGYVRISAMLASTVFYENVGLPTKLWGFTRTLSLWIVIIIIIHGCPEARHLPNKNLNTPLRWEEY